MLLKYLELRERLRTSVWFIPAYFCLAAVALALALLSAERELPFLAPIFKPFLLDVASARGILSVITGGVLSVGGVVFSVTMVALTLTSGQYGPKILRQFLSADGSKISLGMFLGTSVYCLVLMSQYEPSDEPSITVTTALLLTVVALAGFIGFIHRTATDLQADHIIERIGGDLQQSLAQLTKESQINRLGDTRYWRAKVRGSRATPVAAIADGYVQAIDYGAIVAWCAANDCFGQLRVRAGDFVVPGKCFIKLYECSGQLSDTLLKSLRSYVRYGPIRTPVQDPEFPITQLNQLAARALSPGLNDPGTAISCIDSFSMAVARIVDNDMPGKVFVDENDEPRLLARYTDFPGIMQAFYAPSRQFAHDNVPVLISLVDSLIRLAELTAISERLACIAEQGRLLSETVERGSHMHDDLKDFRRRYHKLIRVTRRLKQDAVLVN